MPVTIVVGGQFGGEGKGKTVSHLCKKHEISAVVRCGGPNSGHTITVKNKQTVLRQIPAGVVNKDTLLFLAAGCILDLDVLAEEIKQFDLDHSRLRIDNHALVLKSDYSQLEKESKLGNRIGSTCTGTGIGVAERVLRKENVTLACHADLLKPYLAEVNKELFKLHSEKKRIVIEGTQGFGLSLYHSPYYPYATSRDTTASCFLSEVGLSPRTVSDIIMVLRTFPIRVGGNSGPLPKEINWKNVQKESGYPFEPLELTSVTKRVRRVAYFDDDIVIRAVTANMPTQIALMGLDYLDYGNYGAQSFNDLKEETKEFVFLIEQKTSAPVTILGTGPADNQVIDRKEEWINEQKRKGKRIPQTAHVS